MSSENEHYGVFSEEFKEWIATADITAMDAMDNMSPEKARKLMTTIETSIKDALKGITYTDYTINTHKVTARVFKPDTSESRKRPIALVLHGGGWMYGGHSTETRLVRALVKSGFLPISIDYRLAPEHPFPTPLDDCWAGLIWAIEHANQIGGDASKIILAGSSAGGNLCATVGLMALQKEIHSIRGQILIIPALCHYRHFSKSRFELKSYGTLQKVPVLGAKKMSRFWGEFSSPCSALNHSY